MYFCVNNALEGVWCADLWKHNMGMTKNGPGWHFKCSDYSISITFCSFQRYSESWWLVCAYSWSIVALVKEISENSDKNGKKLRCLQAAQCQLAFDACKQRSVSWRLMLASSTVSTGVWCLQAAQCQLAFDACKQRSVSWRLMLASSAVSTGVWPLQHKCEWPLSQLGWVEAKEWSLL